MQVSTSLVALLGGISLLIGLILILAGIGIITIKQYIHVEKRRGSWVAGVFFILVGAILLFTGERAKTMEETVTPNNVSSTFETTPDIQAKRAVPSPVLTQLPTSPAVTATGTPPSTPAPKATPTEFTVKEPTKTPTPVPIELSVSYLEEFDMSELSELWVGVNAQFFNIEDGRLAFDFAAPSGEDWAVAFIEFKEHYKNNRDVSSVQFSISTTPPITSQFAVIGFQADCSTGQLSIYFDQDSRLIVEDETGNYADFSNVEVLIPGNGHEIKLQFQDDSVQISIDGKNIKPENSNVLCTNPRFLKFLAGGSNGGAIQGFIDNIFVELEP